MLCLCDTHDLETGNQHSLEVGNKGLLLKDTVKTSIANIELSELPLPSKSQCKNNMDGGWLDDRAKRLTIVKARLLEISFAYEMSFITLNLASSIPFNFM